MLGRTLGPLIAVLALAASSGNAQPLRATTHVGANHSFGDGGHLVSVVVDRVIAQRRFVALEVRATAGLNTFGRSLVGCPGAGFGCDLRTFRAVVQLGPSLLVRTSPSRFDRNALHLGIRGLASAVNWGPGSAEVDEGGPPRVINPEGQVSLAPSAEAVIGASIGTTRHVTRVEFGAQRIYERHGTFTRVVFFSITWTR